MSVKPRLRRPVLAALRAALVAGTLCGCAHSYIDADGTRHVIGLVHLTLPPSDPAPRAADWMRTRTVGLALSRMDIGSSLELGYSDNLLAVVRNNSCVSMDTLPVTLLFSPGAPNALDSTDR